jgi:hypothetical protein
MKKLLTIFIILMAAATGAMYPLSAKEHLSKGSKFIKEIISKRKNPDSIAAGSVEDPFSKISKNLFYFSFDDKNNILTVENKKEKSSLQFPEQKESEVLLKLDEEELWVDYGDDPPHVFIMELWHNGRINIEEELNDFIADCEEDGLEYTFSKENKYATLDITLNYEDEDEEDSEDELDFDLENDSKEKESKIDMDKIRVVISEKNIYFLMTEFLKKEEDIKLHETFTHSFKIN